MNTTTRITQHSAAPALFRLPAVLSRVGVSKATLHRWMKAGMFPKSVALTPTRSTVAWSAAAVDAWIASKLAANDGTYAGTSSDDVAQAA